MIADAIKIRGYNCFKKEYVGFDLIKPVNVIIGRNNTGKSHLLDLAASFCNAPLFKNGWEYQCTGVLDETSLGTQFPRGSSGGVLQGNFWDHHGKFFSDVPISWTRSSTGAVAVQFPKDFNYQSTFGNNSTQERIKKVCAIAQGATHRLLGKEFRKIAAERDIAPETANKNLWLSSNGGGATNIIRRHLVTAHPAYPRELIQSTLLNALNKIFTRDGKFTEIVTRQHDEPVSGQEMANEMWEVYLGEEKKGLIQLSQSGSGLKTVILVLLNLLVIPKINQKRGDDYVFAFEELENNLHPALLRRLFQFIEDYAVNEKTTIFLTTHSSVALDMFGPSQHAQIIHVTHDGEFAKTLAVSAHFDHLSVISELGAKPSDLLQANGIVWLEGPSDRVYVNRWIDLFSDGKLREGRDYQCAFYGGALLARTQFTSPEEADTELVNLLRLNPNIAVICDGDRTAESGEGSRIKERVRRIKAEVQKIPDAYIWVTAAKEIENYLPGAVLNAAYQRNDCPDPGQFEIFFPRDGASYAESHLGVKSIDKMELAALAAPHMGNETMAGRFDLEREIASVIGRIRHWNA